jgi:hypothetical protein
MSIGTRVYIHDTATQHQEMFSRQEGTVQRQLGHCHNRRQGRHCDPVLLRRQRSTHSSLTGEGV